MTERFALWADGALGEEVQVPKKEDEAHASGDYGIPLLAVRKDTAAALAGSDGDYAPLEVDATGALHVTNAALAAGTAAIGKVITPSFSVSDSFTRPANTTAYAANKAMNCSYTATGVSYTLKVVTLTIGTHALVAGDRITVAGVNTGATLTNVDGNWVITSVGATTILFTVTSQPTGTSPQTGLTITGAVAKCLSLDVAGVAGGGIVLSRISVSLPAVTMTGAVRVWVYTTQPTVLVDQATFTLLVANDTSRREYFDLYPVTEGTGSDVTFASVRLWEVFKCEAADTRLYFRLSAQGAGTPASGGIVTLRASGVQLLG